MDILITLLLLQQPLLVPQEGIKTYLIIMDLRLLLILLEVEEEENFQVQERCE
jgi:hypothetical protein